MVMVTHDASLLMPDSHLSKDASMSSPRRHQVREGGGRPPAALHTSVTAPPRVSAVRPATTTPDPASIRGVSGGTATWRGCIICLYGEK